MGDTPIWYVHGAFSSSRSFSWIKSQLPEHEATNVEYSCAGSLSRTIEEIARRVEESDQEIDLIGHSLGGVIAVIVARRCANVRRIVTMSSPFGGSRIAAFLQFFTPGSFMESIQPYSSIISEAKTGDTPVPTMSLVTSGGRSPTLPEANDGVVTLRSQQCLTGAHYIDRPVNHFEVLLDPETPKLIEEFLWRSSLPTVR